MNLIESYKNNRIWIELVHTRFTNTSIWMKEFDNFSEFLTSTIQEIKSKPISWTNTFVPIRKMYQFICYASNFVLYTKNGYGHKDAIVEKINSIYSEFHTHISEGEILDKLNSLQKQIKQKNQKIFLLKWLKDLNLYKMDRTSRNSYMYLYFR